MWMPVGARAQAPDNPMQKFGFALLIVFLFVAFGRVPELVGIPYVALLSAILSLIAAAATGGIPLALGSRAGLLLCLFTGCIFVALPFSVWKGGSFALIKETWSRSFMTFVIIAASIHGVSQCRRAVLTFSWATAFIVLASRFRGSMENGRLGMDLGTLKNPNDFAAYLLLGLPFCIYALITPSESKPNRFMSVALLPMVAILILKTGSRSGLLVLLGIVTFMFFKLSARGKLLIAVPAVLLLVSAPFFVPRSVLARYATLLSDSGRTSGGVTDAERQGEFASTSSDARMNLLRKSIILTLQNPLLGVGPGMFAVAVSDYSKELGERAPWQQTHNTYTQVSSELGIPALIVYVCLLIYCIRTMAKVAKASLSSRDPQIVSLGNMAFCVQIACVAFCLVAMFGSLAYHLQVPILAGMTEAIRRAAASYTAPPPQKVRAAMQPVARRLVQPAGNR